MKKIKFTINAKKEFSQFFREAFIKMNASFLEEEFGSQKDVIRFEVECDADKVEILSKDVPFDAYASVGVVGSPPLFE